MIYGVTPRDTGFSARYSMYPRCMNAYPPNTRESFLWEEGWDMADKQITDTQNIIAENLKLISKRV